MLATVAIVWACPLGVEAYAAAGRGVDVPRPECPGCGRPMEFWSGYRRWVRARRVHRIWVRRARCRSCRSTHALLPEFVLLRRVDAVEVIGAALQRTAGGVGLRRIAQALEVPHTTVRDWWRRFRARAGVLSAGLLALAVEVSGDATVPTVGGAAGALVALEVLVAAVGRRLGAATPTRWRLAALVSGGGWLAATMTPPWARLAGPGWMPPVP